MEAQVVKWGNGQGIRLPKLILQELDLHINDRVQMEVEENRIVITKKTFRHQSLEERAKVYGGKLGPYTEYEWGESEGREVL